MVCVCWLVAVRLDFHLKEEQIAELMANSGDSSQQLTLMSEQLREKERFVLSPYHVIITKNMNLFWEHVFASLWYQFQRGNMELVP